MARERSGLASQTTNNSEQYWERWKRSDLTVGRNHLTSTHQHPNTSHLHPEKLLLPFTSFDRFGGSLDAFEVKRIFNMQFEIMDRVVNLTLRFPHERVFVINSSVIYAWYPDAFFQQGLKLIELSKGG